jgi:hypothetical protein
MVWSRKPRTHNIWYTGASWRALRLTSRKNEKVAEKGAYGFEFVRCKTEIGSPPRRSARGAREALGREPNAVMTGLSRSYQPNASAFGDVVEPPETFGLAGSGTAWMAGTSPAMTEGAVWTAGHALIPAPMGSLFAGLGDGGGNFPGCNALKNHETGKESRLAVCDRLHHPQQHMLLPPERQLDQAAGL